MTNGNASLNLAMAASSTVTVCGLDNADVASGIGNGPDNHRFL
ncbi:hypothetical protein [Okeania sp. KiyG1]|nr:hypothetical protein [Okeania sp. KiyG1]